MTDLPFADLAAAPEDDWDIVESASTLEADLQHLAAGSTAVYGDACRLSAQIVALLAENARLRGEVIELRAALADAKGTNTDTTPASNEGV